jgi:hypothetical protein
MVLLFHTPPRTAASTPHGPPHSTPPPTTTTADDPLANDIAELWKANEKLAHANAREWTAKYASR